MIPRWLMDTLIKSGVLVHDSQAYRQSQSRSWWCNRGGKSPQWMWSLRLEGETEDFLIVVQDQNRIMKKMVEDVQYVLVIEKRFTTLSSVTKEEYTHKHDSWNLVEAILVLWNGNATLLSDISINTDRESKANRPDIVFKDDYERKRRLISISIPTVESVSLQEMKK